MSHFQGAHRTVAGWLRPAARRAPVPGTSTTSDAASPVPGGALGDDAPTHAPHVLVLWRWFGWVCAAAVLSARLADRSTARVVLVLAAAAGVTGLVTFARDRGWVAVQRHPALLLADILVASLLVAAGGADALAIYAMSPLLAAAVVAGPVAGLAALALLAGITGSLLPTALGTPVSGLPVQVAATAAGGLVLLCLTLATAVRTASRSRDDAAAEAALRISLEGKNRELSTRNRELRMFEEIASTMQTTMDVTEVQERVVIGLTERLGYRRAIIGLCDPGERHITGWLASTEGGSGATVNHLLTLDLDAPGGALVTALRRDQAFVMSIDDALTETDRGLLEFFGASPDAGVVVVPVRCRGHLVGGILTEAPSGKGGIDSETRTVLERVGTQAGLALANVRLCVERTQKLTQEQERMRIAADMHDGIAQSLFGIVFQLSGAARQLPPGPLRTQLEDLGVVGQSALAQVRRAIFDIWPDELTSRTLERELEGVVYSLGSDVRLQTRIAAEYDSLDLDVRKAIFRISQEAVTNVVRHAQARTAEVALSVSPSDVCVDVIDDGIGIPATSESGADAVGFGVRGMVERAEVMGGELTVTRSAGGGTRVSARLPRMSCRA